MGNLYKNTYKIDTARLTNWDYSKPGYYFLTLCTNNRKIFFGQIINQKIFLNKLGKITEKFWHELPNHFSNILLDEFIIMPNHLHGIILIKSPEKNFDYFFNGNIPGTYLNNINNTAPCRDAIYRVSDNNFSQNKDAMNGVSTGGITGTHNSMGKNTIGKMIRWFKGRSAFAIHKNFANNHFSWQSGFYDHIIRDVESLIAVKNYIINNPVNWSGDHNNPKNLKNI